MNLSFPGWALIGHFESEVGSWLLTHGGEAALLEVPEGLRLRDVQRALRRAEAVIRFVLASHDHPDHIEAGAWAALRKGFPTAQAVHPRQVRGDRRLDLGGEPLWLVSGPKHSPCDVVTVFRGVAMTGDIELGTLASVNDEVPLATRRRSMAWLRDFPARAGYRVHTTVSAHLDDVRRGVHWPDLFTCEG